MEQWLIFHWPQLLTGVIGVVLSPRALRFAHHMWTLQTKYDNCQEKNTYLTEEIKEARADVEYFKELRRGSGSSVPPASIPPTTPTPSS